MVLDLVLKAIFSVIDLLKGAFFLAIIAFILVFIASFFHAWVSKLYKLSWLKATMLTSYLAIFILIMLLYCAPVISAFGEVDQGIVPAEFQTTPADALVFWLSIIARNAAIALLLTFFILPLEFLSSMVYDYLKEKTKLNKWIKVFLAVFAATIAVSIILLFLLDWVTAGLTYLVFYWHL